SRCYRTAVRWHGREIVKIVDFAHGQGITTPHHLGTVIVIRDLDILQPHIANVLDGRAIMELFALRDGGRVANKGDLKPREVLQRAGRLMLSADNLACALVGAG